MRLTLRLLSFVPGVRRWLTAVILCQVLGGLLVIAQAAILSLLVAQVFPERLSGGVLPGLWVGLLGVILLRALLLWLGEYLTGRLIERIKFAIRQRLFEKILASGPALLRQRQTGEVAAVLMEGVENLDAFFARYLPQLIVAAVVPLSILAVVTPRDWISGLIFFLTAPLLPVFMMLIGKAGEEMTRRQWDSLSRLSAHFLDSIQGLTTLKLFGRARDHAHSVDAAGKQFRVATLRVLRLTFLSALVLELLTAISTALVAVEVSLRLLYGKMDFHSAFLVLLLAPEFYWPLRMLALRFHAGMTGRSAAQQISALLEEQEMCSNAAAERESSLPADQLEAVVFDAVSFTYPGTEQPALSDVYLQLSAGQQIALVGRKGAGKSTLVSLLLGFLSPTSGQIYTRYRDGSTESGPPAWSLVAWVSQTPYLFHDTIAANIRMARPLAGEKEIIAAARAAHLDDFVRSLPEGYQTVIGEGGARLSAGQAQRLALARAFLKNAPILVLDEATANLDPREEALILDATRTLMRGRTVVMIAHRLTTAFEADRIVVMEAGRIVESGSHAELLKANGLYARLLVASKAVLPDAHHREDVRFVPQSLPQWPIRTGLDQDVGDATLFDARRGRLSLLLRLLHFLNGSWSWVALSVLLGVLTVGSNVALMGLSAWLVSAAALRPPLGALQTAVVGVRFFGLARGVLRYAERLVSHEVTFRLLERLRSWFYRALEPLAPARLLYRRAGDLLTRVVADVETLENFYGRAVGPPLVAALTALGLFFFFHSLAPAFGQVYLLFLGLVGLVIPGLARWSNRGVARSLLGQRAALRVALVDGIQGLAEVLVFGQSAAYRHKIDRLNRDYLRLQTRMTGLDAWSNALLLLIVQGGGLAILAIGMDLVQSGLLSGVMLAVLLLTALAGFEAVAPLTSAAQTLAAALGAGERLFEIVDAPRPEDTPSDRISVEGPSEKPFLSRDVPPVLECRKLTFAYAPEAEPALQEISFLLPAGGRLAIVGPSGAGKTTLFNLLLRFWQPPLGTILLNGEDGNYYSADEVRALFGVAPQNPFFFYATLRENLLLAQPQADEADLWWVLEQVRLNDLVAHLPQGLDTPIGERGLRLSGGERRCLALARALLTRAPILLFDEPTANLDALTERAILASLYSLPRTCSLIVITHRLVGLENMDEILVLEGGRIAERGSHHALVRRGGLYAQMLALQERVLAV